MTSNAVAFCDLHMHSTASDGRDAPEALAMLAQRAGLEAFALTDHDTAAGVPAAAEAAGRVGIEFVPGIELSADPAADPLHLDAQRATLHILGYFIRHDDPRLGELETWLRDARSRRNPQMIERLNDLGVRIDERDVQRLAGGAIVGRPHIAQALLEKGYVKSVHEAFTRYIGDDAPAHVPKQRLCPRDAIDAIHHAGGLAVLAHPVQLRLDGAGALAGAVARLAALGLDGIETRHSDHTAEDNRLFEQLAARHALLTTGGSDYHGEGDGGTRRLGRPRVPASVYARLRERAGERHDG